MGEFAGDMPQGGVVVVGCGVDEIGQDGESVVHASESIEYSNDLEFAFDGVCAGCFVWHSPEDEKGVFVVIESLQCLIERLKDAVVLRCAVTNPDILIPDYFLFPGG